MPNPVPGNPSGLTRGSRLTHRALGIALGLVLVDLLLAVVTGGVGLLGPGEPPGFLLRAGIALLLSSVCYLRARPRAGAELHAYLALLILVLPLLHYRGYRLRGDGLWYYAYTHSMAFDFDLDLTNQYQWLGIADLPGSQPVRETGLARNTFPVGVGLLWVPLVLAGHLSVFWRNLWGLTTSYDGWSDPYLHTVALGTLGIGFWGLRALDRLLRRWFSPAVAFAAVSATALGSFFLWYLVYQPLYTHAATFLLATLIVDRWLRGEESNSHYWIQGLLVGAAACLRWQTGLFGLLPLARLIAQLRREPRAAVRRGFLLAGGFALGVLPQLLVWRVIFGRLLIGVPLGPDYLRLSDPFVGEVLLSSRHGLFSWSPILILAVLGLAGFVARAPREGWPLVGLLAVLTYVNSSVADWWAGGSFGARRFDSALPLFAIGLAVAWEWLVGAMRRWPSVAPGLLVVSFIAGNLLFMEQYRKGRIPVDDTISYEALGRGMMEDFFDGVGYPFSFPANWVFALRYDRPKTQYDLLVGKYLFHYQNNLRGIIDLGEKDPPFIGNGWSSVTDWEDRPRGVRVAVESPAGIFVPTDRPESLRIVVESAAPRGVNALAVEVLLNGSPVGSFQPGPVMGEHAVTAEKSLWKRINLLEFAARPGGPFLVVDRVRFERLR